MGLGNPWMWIAAGQSSQLARHSFSLDANEFAVSGTIVMAMAGELSGGNSMRSRRFSSIRCKPSSLPLSFTPGSNFDAAIMLMLCSNGAGSFCP
jgi:hypothetical protein